MTPPDDAGSVPPGRPATSPALSPADAERFADRLDELEESVRAAHAALADLAENPLPLGGGADNAAVAAWYRDLLVTDTAPATERIAHELAEVRRALGEGTAAWRAAEERAAEDLRDPGGGS